MKKVVAGILAGALTASMAIAQFPVDPGDDLLLVYRMPDNVAAQYEPNGTSVLDYWSDWDGRDYIHMTPTATFSYPGRDHWTGPEDASMIIKAAGSPAGLYFYVEVSDNVWVDKVPGEMGWAMDAVDLYFDSKSSDAIKAGGADIMVNPAYGWALTYTTQQYQVWMGATALPTTFMLNYYDDLYWTWSYNEVEFSAAAARFDGMSMKVVSLDANTKAQEWFIPWSWVGTGGISNLAQGTKIGFSGGYNDMDGDGAEVKCLRWQRYDPFAGGDEEGQISNNALDSWGDMVIVEEITVGTTLPTAGRVIDNARVVERGLYTLDGQRIAASNAASVRNHSMVIERSVLTDGTVSSRMVRTGR